MEMAHEEIRQAYQMLGQEADSFSKAISIIASHQQA